MLIQVGTRDDFEEGERTCDALVAMWPAAARGAHDRALYRGCHPRLRFAEVRRREGLRQVLPTAGMAGWSAWSRAPRRPRQRARRWSAFSSSSCIPDEGRIQRSDRDVRQPRRTIRARAGGALARLACIIGNLMLILVQPKISALNRRLAIKLPLRTGEKQKRRQDCSCRLDIF